MKTQIIQLSQNEDAISVRDRISWSQARRILLVWPPQGQALHGRLDLNLVARHAGSLGAQLALVTRDAQVRFDARQLGIEVFDNPRSALAADWKDARKVLFMQKPIHSDELTKLVRALHPQEARWVGQPSTRIMCLGVSVLALFILGICILPGAKIILSPQVRSQSMVFDVTVAPPAQAGDIAPGILPTYTREVVVAGQDSTAATGSIAIPDKPATAWLSFTNGSDQAIVIPVGTIVSTNGSDPIRFITTSPYEISIAPGETTGLPATAMLPGPSGNLAASQLSVLESVVQPGLSVTNSEPTYAGSLANAPSPSAQDAGNLRRSLLDKLLQLALVQLQSGLPAGDLLITSSITNAETIAETFFPSVGEPGNQLELSLKIKVRSQAISAAAWQALIIPAMDANTPQGYTPSSSTLSVQLLGQPAMGADGRAHLTIKAERVVQANIPSERAARLVAGETTRWASQNLAFSLPIDGQATIILSPSWWPYLPFLAMRIEVVQGGGP